MDSWSNLGDVKKLVELVETEPKAEEYVREFIRGVASNCDTSILKLLGRAVTDIRQAELQKDAEQN
jgi:hypothetical protein